jgi:hypothetical protein
VANRIGIWIETDPSGTIPSTITKATRIHASICKLGSRTVLEVSTTDASLHRQFYHLATAVAERVIVEKLPAIDAVELELQCFADLLQQQSTLGLERQRGLLGELLLLERLIEKHGAAALDTWLGPLGEAHDFRLNSLEFEVKTTISPNRIHTIHGAEQLLPSDGCSLYLVSVLLGPPGSLQTGFSVTNKVAELTATLAADPKRLSQFEAALEAYSFRKADSGQYTNRYVLRRPLAVARIDADFPALTRPMIQHILGVNAVRIESLEYDINIEGLEAEDGTIGFTSVLPK